ncbi:MAG: acyl-CoA dehydrogenase family protein [Planctomycetaceae bacterium]
MAPETSDAKETFVETALKLGGSSEEEARKTGALDRADEQVEDLFDKKYQTSGSPAHLAVWGDEFPVGLFNPTMEKADAAAQKVMDDSINIVRTLKREGRLLDENRKISNDAINQLAAAGYWGLLVDKEYGGSFVPFTAFAAFLTRMATVDATVSGMASVHGCIGAVDPLRGFGTDEQKQKYLPILASGERISALL